ncbi:MAG: LptF/LptG family permease [Desulfovibrionaceae bacterium]|nr:LptF/LptG family permease [Desulfovibrionaceae bacterium]
MSLLSRYLIRNNFAILIPTLLIGIGLYLLTDLFERLDNFIEADLPLATVLMYFAVKLPLVVSQILPVIFLLSTVIQLCLMTRNRELIALRSGGISFSVIARALLLCGAFWSISQFCFSEYLGVAGERESARIWQEEVRKRNLAAAVLRNLWFTDGSWIASLDTLNPDCSGTGFAAFHIAETGADIDTVIHADSFMAQPGSWTLYAVSQYEPQSFTREHKKTLVLPLQYDPENFRIMRNNTKPQHLPFMQLGQIINRLKGSGSNVEHLRTTWHAKIAYAASLMVMALLAIAIVSRTENIYFAVTAALIATFLYYALHTTGLTLGQKGVISPIWAAWAANIAAAAAAAWQLMPFHRKQ